MLSGPVMVERDFLWEGERRVGPEAFFLAVFDRVPSVRLEAEPALLGFAWLEVSAVPGLDAVEPAELADVVRRLRGTTQPAIAMKCAAAAAITSAWKTSWKPNVRGHRFGLRIA